MEPYAEINLTTCKFINTNWICMTQPLRFLGFARRAQAQINRISHTHEAVTNSLSFSADRRLCIFSSVDARGGGGIDTHTGASSQRTSNRAAQSYFLPY
jgi:hypothetical protein